MAYREFNDPIDFSVADSDYLAEGVSGLFAGIASQQQAKRKASDQFQYDLSEGKFENDQKILSEFSTDVVTNGRDEIMRDGRTSNQTLSKMAQGKQWQNNSKIQFERAKQLTDEIHKRADDDTYYDATPDLEKIKEATHGKDNEVNFYTRGERLKSVEKNLGTIDTFKYDKYKADYVKGVGTMYKSNDYGNPNVTKSRYDQATFWDDKSGKPGVTDDHAIDYLKSDERVNFFFDKKMEESLSGEVERMKASGDPRTSWMKGLSDAEIKNELINDPSKNLINSQDYGVRKREMAKNDLRKADRVNSKVSIEYKDNKENDGPVKNKSLSMSYNFIDSSAVGVSGGSNRVGVLKNPSAGGVLLQNNGKPVTFNTNTSLRTNLNTGVTYKDRIGTVPFTLDAFQVGAFQSTGAPFLFHGTNTEEVVNYINTIPLEHFNPNGKYKLEPTASIALSGFTINKTGLLNSANNEISNIEQEIATATNAGDDEKLAILNARMAQVKLVQELTSSGAAESEILSAANKSGIKEIQQNQIFKASDKDISSLNAITDGFDLRNRENWSEDMKKIATAYESRAAAAKTNGYTDPKAKKTKAKAAPKSKIEKKDDNTFSYNGKTFTQEQINAAAEKSGMTPEEYIKELSGK